MPLPVLLLLHSGRSVSWTDWTIHWSTVIGLAAIGGAYVARVRALRRSAGSVERSAGPDRSTLPADRSVPSRPRQLAFWLGLASVFLSLNGPLHDLSDTFLFSAHMVQHLVLTLLFPPLLLMGLNGAMLRPLLAMRAVGPLLRTLTQPRWCFLVFNIVLAVWHLPPMYNLAMAHHPVHIAQHLMFMAASTLMWWPIASPTNDLPRLPYPGQMLYLFLMSIPMSLVSVYIVYAGNVLYPAYASAPRVLGISPLEDQRLGGLIMWIPGGLFFLFLMTIIFFRWSAKYAEDGTGGAEDGRLVPSRG